MPQVSETRGTSTITSIAERVGHVQPPKGRSPSYISRDTLERANHSLMADLLSTSCTPSRAAGTKPSSHTPEVKVKPLIYTVDANRVLADGRSLHELTVKELFTMLREKVEKTNPEFAAIF